MKTNYLIVAIVLIPFIGFSQLQLTNGLQITNANESNGKVLTSDVSGNATWQNTFSYWQLNGLGGNELRNSNNGGFWSPYPTPLPYLADNTTNPPISPVTGNGTRMAWIPARSAFQAGTFNMADGSVRFVSENIGLFSFCGGLNAEARSRGGIAFGVDAIADGTSNTIVLGEKVRANGSNCIVFGQNSYANASNSLVGGFNSNITDGTSNTILFGESSNANTNSGYGFGRGLKVNNFSCTTLGSFNLPYVGLSTTNWITTQPLFMIGNGTDDINRSNAMVMLKNGKTAIGNIMPESFLHIFESESGAVSGTSNIATFEKNSTGYVGILTPEASESGIVFGLPSNNQSGGIYYNTSNDKRMTFRTNGNTTKMTLLANGNLGIGASTPINPLHIHNSLGAEALIRFTNINSGQTTSDGIEVGYQSDGAGKLFVKENKGLIFGTNNTTRINVLATGEVGIGSVTPTAKLDVDGTTKFGTNGTIINEIIKVTLNGNIGSVNSLSEGNLTLIVTNAAVNSTVYVSPAGGLPAGLLISYAYVSAANTVSIKFYNATGIAINPAARDFYITVIR